ncbi:MAG: hypothetical protein F7B17_05730 [Desulfurococcales archaeon]|nr:hypothetical protein [Desulfurococcales archaeon]
MECRGFARVDTVSASPKGERQGASVNIPARIYEAIGRPSLLTLYVDERGRLLLEPARKAEEPQVLSGKYAEVWLGKLRASKNLAEPALPSQVKEDLAARERVRVALAEAGLVEKGGKSETIMIAEAAEGERAYRLPLPLQQAVKEVLDALNVANEPKIRSNVKAVVIDVDGLKVRTYVITQPSP